MATTKAATKFYKSFFGPVVFNPFELKNKGGGNNNVFLPTGCLDMTIICDICCPVFDYYCEQSVNKKNCGSHKILHLQDSFACQV